MSITISRNRAPSNRFGTPIFEWMSSFTGGWTAGQRTLVQVPSHSVAYLWGARLAVDHARRRGKVRYMVPSPTGQFADVARFLGGVAAGVDSEDGELSRRRAHKAFLRLQRNLDLRLTPRVSDFLDAFESGGSPELIVVETFCSVVHTAEEINGKGWQRNAERIVAKLASKASAAHVVLVDVQTPAERTDRVSPRDLLWRADFAPRESDI